MDILYGWPQMFYYALLPRRQMANASKIKEDLKVVMERDFTPLQIRMIKMPQKSFPVNIYLLKGNNKNTRKRREICSKLTIKTPERCQ